MSNTPSTLQSADLSPSALAQAAAKFVFVPNYPLPDQFSPREQWDQFIGDLHIAANGNMELAEAALVNIATAPRAHALAVYRSHLHSSNVMSTADEIPGASGSRRPLKRQQPSDGPDDCSDQPPPTRQRLPAVSSRTAPANSHHSISPSNAAPLPLTRRAEPPATNPRSTAPSSSNNAMVVQHLHVPRPNVHHPQEYMPVHRATYKAPLVHAGDQGFAKPENYSSEPLAPGLGCLTCALEYQGCHPPLARTSKACAQCNGSKKSCNISSRGRVDVFIRGAPVPSPDHAAAAAASVMHASPLLVDYIAIQEATRLVNRQVTETFASVLQASRYEAALANYVDTLAQRLDFLSLHSLAPSHPEGPHPDRHVATTVTATTSQGSAAALSLHSSNSPVIPGQTTFSQPVPDERHMDDNSAVTAMSQGPGTTEDVLPSWTAIIEDQRSTPASYPASTVCDEIWNDELLPSTPS